MTYDKIWEAAVSLLRVNRDHLLAVAGVFIFLPVLAMMLFFPMPKEMPIDPNGVKAWTEYFEHYGNVLLLSNIIQTVGTGAVLTLLLRKQHLTAAQSILNGVRFLPGLFLYTLIFGVAVGAGLFAFVIPGLYLIGRLVLGTCSIIHDHKMNPFSAFNASFSITRGRGWYIIGIILIIFAVLFIVTQSIMFVFGGLVAISLGAEAAKIVTAILQGLSSLAYSLIFSAVYAALYLRLSGQERDVRGKIPGV